MSKRLKRKVRDLCGLDSLSKEDRLLRAKEILESTKIKQKMCNQMIGLTFKDIERAMTAVLEERQPTEREQEELELRELAPEKFEPFIPQIDRPPAREVSYRPMTREECAWLLAQSNKPIEKEPAAETNYNYKTYTREEVQALLRGDYDPQNTKKALKD